MKFQVFPNNGDISPCKRVKFGIDPTSPRLHLGHLVPLLLVKKMLLEGNNVTIVLGTFTAQLGDPSGRDTTRPILDKAQVSQNAEHILNTLNRILPPGFEVYRNGDVFDIMNTAQFIRIASQFTLSHITSRDAFQKRIKEGNSIALHELLVPICQGWDSVALHTQVEIGGQDQLFNFQVARQLQETEKQPPQTCILMPIINGTDGKKMSKSLCNCIFLDEEPNDIFGKVMSISDEVMEEWFPIFADFTVEDLHPMHKKKMLAMEITSQIHGIELAWCAHENFGKTVQNKELPADIKTITTTTLLDAVVQASDVKGHISKTAARRLLQDGAVQVDGVVIKHENFVVQSGVIIKVGKRGIVKIL